ncbi:hypothetical protein LAZ67_4003451 [Cordylochernes scorpioides]|uniref:Uncharacterized protein n=1 Tax=Cordylochernes scorpioides TaxID=51811 RepID=A0ABY6KDN8_9ARAC|nr:hypothetical protein LAZ67_4003451 [Cordylochernes scorpioides]
MDQRTCIKFCVKNEIKCADAFRMLTVAYGEATLDRSNSVAGRPSTSTTDEKINEVEKMILANRRITVREVAEDLNISIGSCHSIFINDLGMRRVAAKFVPKLLNCDQKQHLMNIANEMLDSLRDDPNFLQRVITGDEVDVVHHEFLPQGRTVKKEYYLKVMRNLREAIRQKRPDLWKNTSLLVRDFLAKNNTLMMPQPPYSPDLAPCPKVTRQTTLETPMEKDLKELIAALSSKMDDWGSKLESRLSAIELGMQKFDTRVQQLESSLELTASAVEMNVKQIRELESRVSFMEMKNREKNLIFYGMEGNGSENPDESRAKIKSLIKDKMQISDEVVISRCRRLSKKDKAPVLVEVPEHSERIKIFKNSFKLRDLKIFVSKDYSPSTREKRRLLIPKWKELLNKGITTKLRDDKLIVNGTVYQIFNGKITTKEGAEL